MNWTRWVGQLLNLDNVQSIESLQASFASPWAHRMPSLVVLLCAALGGVAIWFYVRYQQKTRSRARGVLAASRALLLCLLVLFLADPILTVRFTNQPKPWLWVLFDGTDSMAIEDEYTDQERIRLAEAVELPANETSESATSAGARLSRAEYVQALLRAPRSNLLKELSEKYRIKAFTFDRPDGVRELNVPAGGERPYDGAAWAAALSTPGEATALGRALEDLSLRHSTGHLGGVLMVSDFDQNSGPPPLAPARKLGVPVFTLGIGAEAALDLAVDLQAPLLMKKAERTSLVATLRQTGMAGRDVTVRLLARRLTGDGTAVVADAGTLVGEKEVRLDNVDQPVEFPYTPTETGRFTFTAEVRPEAGEMVSDNNRAERDVNIRDDFLRLMFVEYEPTWEWRFVKEVFHRDQLVGMRGFRTFLRSADPNVRKNNELFLSTLTPKRSDFFANDVLFLGDMPASALSTRFCEMTKEFVSTFGGGLVVMAGPRFGPSQLAQTPLADMLPVIPDSGSRLRDHRTFRLKLTPEAAQVDFMQLGASESENLKAWNNMQDLAWYQPVSRLHPLSTALAVHPTDTCADGKTPQPLIAIRRYGKGEVIYVGTNETWRLRRKYGERYYRQFWGQMIHRLGLSHALGSQKRFVVRTDRQQYQPDDKVLLTVEAYNANFEPLTDEDLPQRKLTAELTIPGPAADGGKNTQLVSIPQLREGVFETRIPVVAGGEHRVVIKDPVTNENTDLYFQVTNTTVERRSAVRNTALQREIATATGGQSYDLSTVRQFLSDFRPPVKTESTVLVRPLWNTWLCFTVVVLLMLGEWLGRKLVNLP